MKVTYIDHMGTDLSVVNAARVSFGKKSEYEQGDWKEDEQGIYVESVLKKKDRKLINYLAKHNHWTPFAHNAITLHIKAPLFVARQLGKHQVGFVWNEVSRRYVDDAPEFYEPEVWRKRADNVKQGSSESEHPMRFCRAYKGDGPVWWDMKEWSENLLKDSLALYTEMIDDGVCPEQARMILPQSMYTEWYWTGNLYGFSNVYKLRTDTHSQKETQEVARQIGSIIEPLFPFSWKALT